jgi:histidyl-tRNA synthetase
VVKTPFGSPSSLLGSEGCFIEAGYEEVIVPAIWEQATFVAKAGPEIVNSLYAFADRSNRACCLIPEVTGLIQEEWRRQWSKVDAKPCRLFYVARCYRYDRPQAGRYREFTQVGVELLGGAAPGDRDEVIALLARVLDDTGIDYTLDPAVKRGLAYYTEDGFEARCDVLGAQKQVAGGGRYAEGIGWALGLDRLLLVRANDSG